MFDSVLAGSLYCATLY